MKRFIVSILCVSVFFIGLGALADNVGAMFKSDEKALEIIKRARVAIGGEAAIAEVRSMIIKGQATHTIKVDGVERTETGEGEIAMQLPDRLSKMIKLGKHDGAGGGQLVDKQVDVIVLNKDGERVVLDGKEGEFTTPDGKKVIVRKSSGSDLEEISTDDRKVVIRKSGNEAAVPGEDGKKILLDKVRVAGHDGMRQNELLRTTLSLLLTAPQGIDVDYTYGGETSVEGTACDVINAGFGGSAFKLLIAKSTSLPVAMIYTGHRMPKVMKFNKEAAIPAEKAKDTVFFTKKLDGPGESAEFTVRFSDYRSVNGVQLPYKWTTTVAGTAYDVFDVTSYEINPANIAEKFQNQKVFVRKAKPVEN